MINVSTLTRYTPTCDNCGWRGSPSRAEASAQRDFDRHPCGVHRQAHDSTGGYRGILGGQNRYCVCGAHHVSDPQAPFACPRDTA